MITAVFWLIVLALLCFGLWCWVQERDIRQREREFKEEVERGLRRLFGEDE